MKVNMGPVILVVDDETDSADLLGTILEMFLPQAVVQVVYGGHAALEAAQQRRPDAAVLDLEMPELDGEKLAMALRTSFPDAAPLLIALSGNVSRLATVRGTGAFDPPHEQAGRRPWPRSLAEHGASVLGRRRPASHAGGNGREHGLAPDGDG
jgi:CheY-like chemotaxis protein